MPVELMMMVPPKECDSTEDLIQGETPGLAVGRGHREGLLGWPGLLGLGSVLLGVPSSSGCPRVL